MPRENRNAPPHLGHGSPSRTTRRSAYASGTKSLPGTTSTRCASFSFAPVAPEAIDRTEWSATVRTESPTGPANPDGAPVTSRTRSSPASRT